MIKNNVIFLIPTYLSEQNDSSFIAPMVVDVIKNTNQFLVENARTARRFISSLKTRIDISQLRFEILDKNSTYETVSSILEKHKGDWGVISEAGLPGLADPGSLAISYAHKNGIKVVPLPGASAIQTAVISSGFNGQQFTFQGYLPIQKTERERAIKQLELDVNRSGFTQIFMETPFRNMQLFDDLINSLDSNTWLNISCDLFGNREFIKTQPISQWKNQRPNLHKLPTVFCLGQMS